MEGNELLPKTHPHPHTDSCVRVRVWAKPVELNSEFEFNIIFYLFEGIKSEWSNAAQCPNCHFFFYACTSLPKHNNMHYARQHPVRSARLLRFGEMFQWRKSLVCCFGALICICGARRHQFYVRCHLFYSHQMRCCFFVLLPQQMAAVNFGNFFGVKLFVKMNIAYVLF